MTFAYKLPKHKNILVGVDDSADAQLAFLNAVSHALEDDSLLHIVTVLESDSLNVFQALDKTMLQEKRATLEKRLQDYQKQAQDAGVKEVHIVLAQGEPGETIVKDVIPKVQPDMVVVGAAAKTGLGKLMGSQAGYVAKYSPVTVLVVR
ncbi:universal stress protein [Periweissella beninensis]|uniref:Universal stress protein n=1 Tax=Periweissella beninensis TaxID=504936 RepID=A0ABT0VG97_9LACO|nr:universal stress protein [Periweissella beninensis]MBM7543460.1 nucleotide-binding universal stress UspA family protein [Periweissella beninensis]MCM2436444.1 universal stress protein [Periweissella beninensis]MCT4396824.1 universal stress protein [Periweissella beninensis]